MPEFLVPQLRSKPSKPRISRQCGAHRSWVKRHWCSVRGCRRTPIECAHVRFGTDAGIGLKPSDRWVISLCQHHHREQHRIGERAFEAKYSLNLRELAEEFAKRSPYHSRLAPQ